MGPSGSGQTTLINISPGASIHHLRPPSLVNGADINSSTNPELSPLSAEKIGFVFQQLLWPVSDALRNVMLAPKRIYHSVTDESQADEALSVSASSDASESISRKTFRRRQQPCRHRSRPHHQQNSCPRGTSHPNLDEQRRNRHQHLFGELHKSGHT